MNIIEGHASGSFNWADLATNDTAEAKAFYAGLFGWTAQDIAVGQGTFTMLRRSGQEIASLYQLSTQQRAQGVPSHWMAYVAVTNADETVRQAQQLGGQALVTPFDVLDLGRMALLLDPTGAPLAVWQAKHHVGARLVNRPGTLAWYELITPDPARAATFYTKLFDWQAESTGDGLVLFSSKGYLKAGMKRPILNQDMPQWRVYFATQDCDAGVAETLVLGGKIIASPEDSLVGCVALVQDPQGATFGLIAPNSLL